MCFTEHRIKFTIILHKIQIHLNLILYVTVYLDLIEF